MIYADDMRTSIEAYYERDIRNARRLVERLGMEFDSELTRKIMHGVIWRDITHCLTVAAMMRVATDATAIYTGIDAATGLGQQKIG